MVGSQIKFWVFGLVGAVGVYLLLTGWGANLYVALGISLIGGAAVAMALGGVWDYQKDSETAATYRRETRDEVARQEYLAVQQKGAKQITTMPAKGAD
jgi:hypothetical protein